jgi:chemotaxis methyl-accepting protein methylase
MAWSYQQDSVELSPSQFQQWQELLEQRTGIDLSQHPSILAAGLKRSMQASGANSFDDYFLHVTEGPAAVANWARLVDYLSITETSFFRQNEAMSLARDYLLERLSAPEWNSATFDIWSAGCASGEEAYSLAMIANEVIAHLRVKAYLGIVASDINAAALASARRGVYASRRLERVPKALRHKYFVVSEDSGKAQIVASLKQQICFVQSNLLLLEQTPVMPMDLIYCQNLLVYFRRQRIHQLLDDMVKRLKPGGLLIVGPGEAAQWQNPAVVKVERAGVQAFMRRSKKTDVEKSTPKKSTIEKQ